MFIYDILGEGPPDFIVPQENANSLSTEKQIVREINTIENAKVTDNFVVSKAIIIICVNSTVFYLNVWFKSIHSVIIIIWCYANASDFVVTKI